MTYRKQLSQQGKITPIREERRKAKSHAVLHGDEIKTCLNCTRPKCSGCGAKKRERMKRNDNR